MSPDDEIEHVGRRVVAWIADDRRTLPGRPAFQPYPSELADRLATSRWPEVGESADAILDEFEKAVGPYPFGNGHPRFYGWVNSPPDAIGVLAEALAAAMKPRC